MNTTRRNEGGRYSAKGASDWYRAIAIANIQAVEARINAEKEAADDAERALVTALAKQVDNAIVAMPEAAERIRKAAKLVQAKAVWPLSGGNFLVGSESDAKAAYLVSRGPWSCDCRWAQTGHTRCSHQIAVMLTVKMGAAYTPSY